MLSAVIMAKKGVVATTFLKQIRRDSPFAEDDMGKGLFVEGSEEDCNAVAAALTQASWWTEARSASEFSISDQNSGPALLGRARIFCGQALMSFHTVEDQAKGSLIINRLYVNGSLQDCQTIAHSGLRPLWYGSTVLTSIGCGYGAEYVKDGLGLNPGPEDDQCCIIKKDGWLLREPGAKATAHQLNAESIYHVRMLNNILHEQMNFRVGSSVAADTATDLADVKAQLASSAADTTSDFSGIKAQLVSSVNNTSTDLADMKAQLASSAMDSANNLADIKAQLASSVEGRATDLADMKGQLARMEALLTPECVANRFARAQENPANHANPAVDPANPATIPAKPANDPEGKKTNIFAIVTPIVAVLLLVAIVIAVAVTRKRREADAPPASAQPNPAFNLAANLANIAAP